MPGAVDPQELLIRAMVGQQITVAAARTALTQLSAAGSPSAVPGDGLDRLFPTAGTDRRGRLGTAARPAAAIDPCGGRRGAGRRRLDFGYGDDLPGLGAKLLPLAGVGPWTVGYVAMRVIGAPDIFLANDAAVRNGIRALAGGATLETGAPGNRRGPEHPGTPERGAAPSSDFREVSPWRSYATMHLWRAAAAGSKAAVPKTAVRKTAELKTGLPTTPNARRAQTTKATVR